MPERIISHLKKCSSVAIFVHVNPDWDCMGSAFALRNALRSENIKSDIFTDEPLPRHLGFMQTDVIPYQCGAAMPDYECFCAVDVGATERMGKWGAFFKEKENTVCIDHHHQSLSVAKLNLVEPSRSATGELIFEILSAGDISLTKEIASYLYCAISSDTGSFQYSSVNRRTYEILVSLYDAGINTTHLCSMMYERNTLTQLKLRALAINSIKLYKNGTVATVSITKKELDKYGAVPSDTEAIAQIPRSVDGVMASAFIKETEKGNIRVSLRSLGDYNIEPVARHFGGGGHKKAAGCTLKGISVKKAEKLIVKELLKL